MQRLTALIRGSISQAKKLTDKYKLSEEQIADILRKPTALKPTVTTPTKAQKLTQQLSSQAGIKELVYGLPVENQAFPVVLDQDEKRITNQTPTQNMFAVLNLNALSSYEDYQQSLQIVYNNELDMYGDVQQKAVIKTEDLEFGHLLTYDSKYLAKLRQNHTVNINIPGTIECQDPNNFLTLRPVQQFRHTPLIPISETAMQKHKEMLEEYHRRAFVFEVSRETIVSYGMMFVAGGVLLYLFNMIMEKEEQSQISHQRLKYKRMMGDTDKASLI